MMFYFFIFRKLYAFEVELITKHFFPSLEFSNYKSVFLKKKKKKSIEVIL